MGDLRREAIEDAGRVFPKGAGENIAQVAIIETYAIERAQRSYLVGRSIHDLQDRLQENRQSKGDRLGEAER